jgi:hypothetical protein
MMVGFERGSCWRVVRRRHNPLLIVLARYDGTTRAEKSIPKNTTRAMLYWFDVSLRSSAIPAIFALPMLRRKSR